MEGQDGAAGKKEIRKGLDPSKPDVGQGQAEESRKPGEAGGNERGNRQQGVEREGI